MMLHSTKPTAPTEERRYLAEYYTVISAEGPFLFIYPGAL